MFNPLKRRIGRWASDKAFAYYKTQTDTEGKPGSYKDLPRYLEMLCNWYGGGRLHSHWVIRSGGNNSMRPIRTYQIYVSNAMPGIKLPGRCQKTRHYIKQLLNKISRKV